MHKETNSQSPTSGGNREIREIVTVKGEVEFELHCLKWKVFSFIKCSRCVPLPSDKSCSDGRDLAVQQRLASAAIPSCSRSSRPRDVAGWNIWTCCSTYAQSEFTVWASRASCTYIIDFLVVIRRDRFERRFLIDIPLMPRDRDEVVRIQFVDKCRMRSSNCQNQQRQCTCKRPPRQHSGNNREIN